MKSSSTFANVRERNPPLSSRHWSNRVRVCDLRPETTFLRKTNRNENPKTTFVASTNFVSVLFQRFRRQLMQFLPVQLCRSAVVLLLRVFRRTAVLLKERFLNERRRNSIDRQRSKEHRRGEMLVHVVIAERAESLVTHRIAVAADLHRPENSTFSDWLRLVDRRDLTGVAANPNWCRDWSNE